MADHQDDDEDVLLQIAMAAAVVAVTASSELINSKKRKRRTMWVRPLFQRRCELGAYNMLMAELRESDTSKYHAFTRLTVEDFDELLSIVKDDIFGSSLFRMPIPPDVRLAVTLRYLATGESIFSSSSVNFNSWLSHFRGSVRCSAAVTALNLWLAIIVSSMRIATYLRSTVILIKLGHKTISGLARKWSPNVAVYIGLCLLLFE